MAPILPPRFASFSSDLMHRFFISGVKDYAIYMLDPEGTIMNWNEGAARIKGYSAEEVVGQNFAYFYSPAEQREGVPAQNLRLALERGGLSAEGQRYRKDGSAFWASVTIDPIRDETGVLLGFAKITRDLTEQRKAAQALAHQARHDALTGINNRIGFVEAIERELRLLQPDGVLVLLYVDLDRFKPINDAFGHEAGDAVLIEVASRLKHISEDARFVGRLGGDEFAVITSENSESSHIQQLAEKIIVGLNEPILIGEKSASIGASIGIALAPAHGTDSKTLIRNADLALYQAKRNGRNRACMFSPAMNEIALTRSFLESMLRHAIAANEFELAYQPIIDGRTDRLIGFEALLRWTNRMGKSVSPSIFVPLAEELNLMTALGTWALRKACHEAMRWDDSLFVAVNISPTQLRSEDIVETIQSVLEETGLPGSRLELEITETAVLDDWDLARHILQQLRKMDIRITLDDFGTGFSSLSLVGELPLTRLKIDRSFVRGIDGSERSTGIVRAIITLCESYGLAATAEGVETEEQKQILLLAGCHDMQGFLFGRPQSDVSEASRGGSWPSL